MRQVYLTLSVIACAPVNPQGVPDGVTSDREFRNLTIGFGGNVAFVTTAVLNVPVEGIAYRCP
jgi:hypothetical protein